MPNKDKRAQRKVASGKPRLVKKFGYNYEAAEAAGLGPDETGHWPSRNPEDGMILKGRKHPTIDKTIAGEKALGYKIIRKNRVLYSQLPETMSTSKDKFKSKTPRSDKPSGVSISDILAFAAGKKPGDALTAADIDVAVKKAGVTGKDAKAIRNATDKFLSSGNRFMLQGDGNYNVYGTEGQVTTQKRSTGNKVGFGAGDIVGLGNNMSKLVGLAKMYKGAFDESKKATSTPAEKTETAPAESSSGKKPTVPTGDRKLTAREIMEAKARAQDMLDSLPKADDTRSRDLITNNQPQTDKGIADWRTAGKPGKGTGKNGRTTPGMPAENNLIFGNMIRAFDPKTWERLGIAFNPAQVWDEAARQEARTMAQEDMQETGGKKGDKKEVGAPVSNMGLLTPGPKQLGPTPFKGLGDKVGNKMKGAFDKLAGKMAPKVKMPGVQKVVTDQLPAAKKVLQLPQNASKASDKLLQEGQKRLQGFGTPAKPRVKMPQKSPFENGGKLPKGEAGMKFGNPLNGRKPRYGGSGLPGFQTGGPQSAGKNPIFEETQANMPAMLKNFDPSKVPSKGALAQPNIQESGAFKASDLIAGAGGDGGEGNGLAAFGKVAKYALPFIGTQLANKELGKVKPMSFKKASLQSGVVSDIPRPNMGLRYRVPTGNDVQTEIAGQKFADAQARDAEANFNVANAQSRIAQKQQIVNNQNRNEMFNTQGENHARMFNANQLLNTQGMRAQNAQEPYIAAQHHLATDISTDAYLKSSKDMDSAEIILKTAKPGSPEYQAALKKMGYRKGGKLKAKH